MPFSASRGGSFSSRSSFSTSSGRSYNVVKPSASSIPAAKSYSSAPSGWGSASKTYPSPTMNQAPQSSFGKDLATSAAHGAAGGLGAGIGFGVANSIFGGGHGSTTVVQQPAQVAPGSTMQNGGYAPAPVYYQDNSWSFGSILFTVAIIGVAAYIIKKKFFNKG